MLKKIFGITSSFVGFIVLWLLYIKMEPLKIISAMASFDATFLFSGLLCANAAVCFQVLRGYLLLLPVNQTTQPVPSFWRYTKLYYISMCIATITPGRIGLLAQIPLLKHTGVNFGNSTVNTLLDKFYDLTAFCMLASASASALVLDGTANKIMLFFIAIISLFITIYLDSIIHYIILFLSKKFENFKIMAVHFFISPIPVTAKLLAILTTAIRILMTLCMHLFIALSLDIHISAWLLVALTSFGALSSLLPFTIMGAGARDVIFLMFITTNNYDGAHIIAYSSVILFCYVSVNFIGAFLMGYDALFKPVLEKYLLITRDS